MDKDNVLKLIEMSAASRLQVAETASSCSNGYDALLSYPITDSEGGTYVKFQILQPNFPCIWEKSG
jgi:hypothetical protein